MNGSMRRLPLALLVAVVLVLPAAAQAGVPASGAAVTSSMQTMLKRYWLPFAGKSEPPTPAIARSVENLVTIRNHYTWVRTMWARWTIHVCLDNGVQKPATCTWSHTYSGVVSARVPAARWHLSCTATRCVRVLVFGTKRVAHSFTAKIASTVYGGRLYCWSGRGHSGCSPAYGLHVTKSSVVIKAQRG
jgi:hypothetical protein